MILKSNLFTGSILFIFGVLLPVLACGPNLNKIRDASPAEQYRFGKKLYDDDDYNNAKIVFDRVARLNVMSDFSDSAQYMLAESYFKTGEMILARSEYERLVRQFPGSPMTKDAMFKVGLCYYEQSRRPELDQDETLKAIRAFNTFLDMFPQDQEFKNDIYRYLDELREKLAVKKFKAGDLYRKMGDHEAAIIYFNDVLREYYDTQVAARALFRKAECLAELDRYSEAHETYRIFIDNFPRHELIQEVRERLGELPVNAGVVDTLGTGGSGFYFQK